jgi:anaerobic magnesium-protoporphyrin IX monomethyl ester cyclase
MKILLTHAYFIEEDAKEMQIMRPYVPLGILSISAYLEQNGFDNDVYDSTFNSLDNFKSYLLEHSPDVIAIYTNLMTKINVLKIIKYIRSEEKIKNKKIILGGPEVRHHAENFLSYGADIIVIGEGEETMLELVGMFACGKNNLAEVTGIAYLDSDNKLITTAERKLIRDINDLPFPNRKKIDLRKYASAWKDKHGYSMFSVSTMRGCPYTCKWCSRAVYGGTYRRRKPSLVAEELQILKKEYNPDMVWFVDDVFTINHKWLREFVVEVNNRDAKIPYEIISRSDRLNEEVFQLLKESGCVRIWIGAESGSQKIIDAMDRRVDVKEVRAMIKLAKTYGIKACTFIMLGYPGEEKQDIRETINHLKESDPDLYTITIAYPIKGTPLYDETESRFYGQLEWETNTDRDIDFKRTRTRKFYEYGIRWVFNEVNLYKELARSNSSLARLTYYKLKSIAAQGGMWFESLKTL